MDHIKKKQKLEYPNINIMDKSNIPIINSKQPIKPNGLYCVVEKSSFTNPGNCILCNVYIGEDNPEQLCNKIYCSNS